jgi:WD40 repeat protein
LLAPTRDELSAALGEAVAEANGSARQHCLDWPLADLSPMLDRVETEPQGWKEWYGVDHEMPRVRRRSAVGLVWWADRLGRRHVYLAADRQNERTGLGDLLQPRWALHGLLPLIAPRHSCLVTCGTRSQVYVLCSGCGVYGTPEAIGWMGDCCGPCHDRRESCGGVDPSLVRHPWLLEGHEAGVGYVVFSPDSRWLATACEFLTSYGTVDLSVRVWDLAARSEVLVLTIPRYATQLAFSPGSDALAVATDEWAVSVWGVPDGALRAQQTFGDEDMIRAIGWSLTTNELLIDLEPRMYRWVVGGELHLLLDDPDFGSRTACAFADHGRRLIRVDQWGRLIEWQLESVPRRLPTQELDLGVVDKLVFSPDGRTLAFRGAGSTTMFLWDLQQHELRQSFTETYWGVTDYCFTPDGRLFVAVRPPDQVCFRDPYSGAEEAVLFWNTEGIRSLAVSPDGRLLATGSSDGTVALWPAELWQNETR